MYMYTCQVDGHHDKMAWTNTHINKKTHRTPRRNIHLENDYFLCLSYFYFLFFLLTITYDYLWLWFLQEMLRSLNGTFGSVNDFYWGFKQVSSYSKHHTFSTWFREENETNAFTFSYQAIKNLNRTTWKWKVVKLKRKSEKEGILSTKVFSLWKSSQVRGRMVQAKKR